MLFARSLLSYVCFYIWSVPVVLAITPLLLGPRRWMNRGVRFWARTSQAILRRTVGLSHEFRGLENLPDGPAVLACKHQSAWETYGFYAIDPDPAYVLKKELIHIPFFGWFMLKADMVVVDRGAGGAAMKKMLADTKRALGQGRRVIIFPEGTRTAPGRRRDYHPGIAFLYSRLDAPVVPVALNSGMFWSRRSILKYPGVVTVEFLPALPAGLDRAAFLAELRTRIETATARLQREAVARYGVPAPVAAPREPPGEPTEAGERPV